MSADEHRARLLLRTRQVYPVWGKRPKTIIALEAKGSVLDLSDRPEPRELEENERQWFDTPTITQARQCAPTWETRWPSIFKMPMRPNVELEEIPESVFKELSASLIRQRPRKNNVVEMKPRKSLALPLAA